VWKSEQTGALNCELLAIERQWIQPRLPQPFIQPHVVGSLLSAGTAVGADQRSPRALSSEPTTRFSSSASTLPTGKTTVLAPFWRAAQLQTAVRNARAIPQDRRSGPQAGRRRVGCGGGLPRCPVRRSRALLPRRPLTPETAWRRGRRSGEGRASAHPPRGCRSAAGRGLAGAGTRRHTQSQMAAATFDRLDAIVGAKISAFIDEYDPLP
jgi:hypothetical protein